MFVVLAADGDARVAGALERMLEEAARAQAFAGDATLLLCTDNLDKADNAHALFDAALSAWGEGRLVIVRIDGAPVAIGFRDVPVIAWQAEEAVGAAGGQARAAFVATFRELLTFAAQGGERPHAPTVPPAQARAPSGALLFASGGVIAVLAALALGFALTRELSRTPPFVMAVTPKVEPAAGSAKTGPNTEVDLEAIVQKNLFNEIPGASPDAQGSNLVNRSSHAVRGFSGESEATATEGAPKLKGKTARERAEEAARTAGILAILGAQNERSNISGIFGHSPNEWADYASPPGAGMTRDVRLALVRTARERAETSFGERRRRIAVLADNVEHQDARLAALDEAIAKLQEAKGAQTQLSKATGERDALASDVDGLASLLRDELDSPAAPSPSPKNAAESLAGHVTMGTAVGRARDPSLEEAFAGVATINERAAKDSLDPQQKSAEPQAAKRPAALAAIPAASSGAVSKPSAAPTPPPSQPWGLWLATGAAVIVALAGIAWFVFLRRRGGAAKQAIAAPEDFAPTAAVDIATAGIFASYARADSQQVDQLVEAIESTGVPVWVDRKRLPGGVRWPAEIVKAIRESKALVVFCSSSAFSSDDVFREVHLAARFRKNLIPVALDGTPAPDAFLFYLAPQNFIPASDAGQVRRAIGALLAGSQPA